MLGPAVWILLAQINAIGNSDPSAPASSLIACATVEKSEASPIPGATVILIAPDGKAVAGTAGSDGCVAFAGLEPGAWRITVTSPGTKPVDGRVEIGPAGGARFDAQLALVSSDTQELVVDAAREQPGETRRSITPAEVRNMPGVSNDALKSVQNLPGVARAPFGAGMLVVRGAAPGDTRVLLDGQEIPQLYHFGGLRSVFPTEALSRIDFLPGGFGVRYGRAIGGVVDVETRGGREDKWGGFVDADLYDAAALAEGPIGRDARNGHVLAAVRRSYVDAILPAVAPSSNLQWTVAPRYYDYQARYDFAQAENGTRARLMVFGSDDAFTFLIKRTDASGLRGRYLFRTAFHRVQSPVTKPLPNGWILSLMPSLGYQDLNLDGGGLISLKGTRESGGMRLEARGPMRPGVNLLMGFDGGGQRDAYDVNYFDDGGSHASSPDRRQIAKAEYGSVTGAAYAEAEIDAGRGVTVVPGLRADGYAPSNQVSFDPRIAARWRFERRSWAKAYTGLYHQPPEFYQWDPRLGNPRLAPPVALQSGLGGGHQISESMSLEGEAFYKWLDRLVVQAPGDPADPSARTHWTNAGMGRVYGFEALLRRDVSERVFGWVSYTLSKSERASPWSHGWNDYTLDQTHIFTTVGGWRLARNWQAGFRFRYVTGNPTTVVNEAVYDSDSDRYLPVPGFRHEARLPPFHQLDVRIDKRWEWTGWTLDAYLDVQNAYAHLNPEQVRYSFDYSQRAFVTGLPVFPSIGVRGEF